MTELAQELVSAHQRGDVESAVGFAIQLARADQWDRLVAATLVAHGETGDPLTDRALVELTRIETVRKLAADPASDDQWRGTLAVLIDGGRVGDAVTGVTLAAREGLIGPDPWKMLLVLLVDGGYYVDAIVAARAAAEANVTDVDLHAMRALLACECDELREAEEALKAASRLAPDHPMVWVGRARLAFAHGDQATAEHALATARSVGADDDVVSWIGLSRILVVIAPFDQLPVRWFTAASRARAQWRS